MIDIYDKLKLLLKYIPLAYHILHCYTTFFETIKYRIT